MFETMLIHPRTRAQLTAFVTNPSHGLILTGPEGAGKKALAALVAALLLKTDKLSSYPYYSLIDPVDHTITIDEIRELQKLLTLKTPAVEHSTIRRVITILDAGRMRFEAQNAFLKNLEEPPVDTCIILTAEASGNVLETMYSRVQRIDILPVSESNAREYFTQHGIAAAEITRNYALSQGQVGLLHSLLSKEAEHPLQVWVDTAKQLLAKPAGERLLQTDELSKDKVGITLLLDAFGRIAHAALMGASTSGSTVAIARWQQSLQAVQEAQSALIHNANTKLLLDHLLLSI